MQPVLELQPPFTLDAFLGAVKYVSTESDVVRLQAAQVSSRLYRDLLLGLRMYLQHPGEYLRFEGILFNENTMMPDDKVLLIYTDGSLGVIEIKSE